MLSNAKKSLAGAVVALALGAPQAYASGSKIVFNNSSVGIIVKLFARVGSDPADGRLPPVTAVIPPGQSVTLQYGSDANPYLNVLAVQESSNGSGIFQVFTVSQRGGPGTLDNLFNANGELILTYTPGIYGFALDAD